jgi:hypothetical protein
MAPGMSNKWAVEISFFKDPQKLLKLGKQKQNWADDVHKSRKTII